MGFFLQFSPKSKFGWSTRFSGLSTCQRTASEEWVSKYTWKSQWTYLKDWFIFFSLWRVFNPSFTCLFFFFISHIFQDRVLRWSWWFVRESRGWGAVGWPEGRECSPHRCILHQEVQPRGHHHLLGRVPGRGQDFRPGSSRPYCFCHWGLIKHQIHFPFRIKIFQKTKTVFLS